MLQVVQCGQVLKGGSIVQMPYFRVSLHHLKGECIPAGRLFQCYIKAICVACPQNKHLNVPHIAVQDITFRFIQNKADVGFHSRVFPLDDIIFAMLDGL